MSEETNTPSPETQMTGEPVGEITAASTPAAELLYGRDVRFYEAMRTLPIGTKLYAEPQTTGNELPADVIESLLAIGPVEWGQTFCQSDEKHMEDFRDTLRITREHFEIEAQETTISYVAIEGTSTILANTGNSPNSRQHARILVGAWNQLVDIAKAQKGNRKVVRHG